MPSQRAARGWRSLDCRSTNRTRRSPTCRAASARGCCSTWSRWTAPHLLILDEPTNHLDIDSRRALLDALNDYEGAVIMITHDRSLMELVADRLWLAADGHIKPFKGDMDDYARFVLERARSGSRPSQDDETGAARPQGGREEVADAKAVLTRDQAAARQARYAAKKAAKLKRRESR